MIKSILVSLCSVLLIIACSGPTEPKQEILYDHVSKECWVVERGSDGYIEEAIFHAESLKECEDFINN